MWDRLTDEERAWKEGARQFAEASIRPHYREADRANVLPVATHDAAFDDGQMNISFPAELGGLGLPYRQMVIGGEEMAAVCAPTAFSMGFNHGALRPVLTAGTDTQKERFIRDLLERRGYASLCLTEADRSGSNLAEVASVAERRDSGWVLDGTKCMVGNGCVADLFLVLAEARDNGRSKGLTFFAVPLSDRVHVGPNTDKIGFRCVTTPEVRFDRVELDDDHVIGEVGGAEPILQDTLDFIRLGGTSVILGTVVGAMRDAVEWIEQRAVFGGEPLVAKSHVQIELGGFYSRIRSIRSQLWSLADRFDRNEPASVEASIAKLHSSELAVEATGRLVQIYGWRGIDNDYDIQKRYRDARVTTIFEGTSEVQRMVLFKELRRSVRGDGYL